MALANRKPTSFLWKKSPRPKEHASAKKISRIGIYLAPNTWGTQHATLYNTHSLSSRQRLHSCFRLTKLSMHIDVLAHWFLLCPKCARHAACNSALCTHSLACSRLTKLSKHIISSRIGFCCIRNTRGTEHATLDNTQCMMLGNTRTSLMFSVDQIAHAHLVSAFNTSKRGVASQPPKCGSKRIHAK